MSLFSIIEISAPLRQTLAECVPVLHRHCRDPWVVIGSAAGYLAGAHVAVADLDILTSSRDADTVSALWRERQLGTDGAAGAERFRSRFARFAFPQMEVELMGDLEVCEGEHWSPVRVDRIIAVQIDGLTVPVPAVADQIRMLARFARPKDAPRLAQLQRILDASP